MGVILSVSECNRTVGYKNKQPDFQSSEKKKLLLPTQTRKKIITAISLIVLRLAGQNFALIAKIVSKITGANAS